VLAVYFKEEWLKQVYSEAITRDGMQFALCDQQNNIISASDTSLFSNGLPFTLLTGEKDEGKYSTSTCKDGNMLIIYNTIPTTQWYRSIYCPMRVMLKDAFQLERIAYFFCGLICLVALLVARTISQNITRPLKELNKAIACSGSGQFNTLLPATGPEDVQKLIST
jgi:sensor histidine kinase YesM